MGEKILKTNDVFFIVKDYASTVEYLLGGDNANKYILHLYKDEEDNYHIDLTDNDYFLTAIEGFRPKNFKSLFYYETLILGNLSKMEYDNIERIKKIYDIEDINYNSNLNKKLKNVLFNVNNYVIDRAYIFFENYVYKVMDTDKNNIKIYQIFRNNSNFKNCIVNTFDDLFDAPTSKSIENKGNILNGFIEEICFKLIYSKTLDKVDVLLKYGYMEYDKKKVWLKSKNLKIRKFTEIGNNSLIKQEIILLYIIFIILCDVEKEVRYMTCKPESVAELIDSYLDSRKLDSGLFYSLFEGIYPS